MNLRNCFFILLPSEKWMRWVFELPQDKINKMACAPSEDSYQPGHSPSLFRVFAVCLKKLRVFSYPLSAQWRLIRLGWCPGRSESLLGAKVILLVLSWGGSILMLIKTSFSSDLHDKKQCCGCSLKFPQQGSSDSYLPHVLHYNISCRFSELPQWGNCNEHPQHIFHGDLWRIIPKLSFNSHHMSHRMTKPTKWPCTQPRLRSESSLCAGITIGPLTTYWAHSEDRMKKHWALNCLLSAQWRLIRLGECPGWSEIHPIWSESSLGAQVILLGLSCSSSHQFLRWTELSTLAEMWENIFIRVLVYTQEFYDWKENKSDIFKTFNREVEKYV